MRSLVAIVFSLGLAFGGAARAGEDLSGAAFVHGDFRLTDAKTGKAVDRHSYDGRFRLVFFGFTGCGLVCPLGLHNMHLVLEELGPAAKKVAPLFISIDPERDTAAKTRAYAARFDPRIQSLVGGRPAVDAAQKSFRLESEKIDAKGPHDYQIEHPSIFYLMGPQGEYRTTLSAQGKPEDLAAQIEHELALP